VIVAVTPNPALDVTYEVKRLVPHTSHRVLRVHEVAGGKGINVASVLTVLGHVVVATGALGGPAGEQLKADLDARGIAHDFLDCGLPTRRTVTVVSTGEGEATAFNEPGPPWVPAQCDALADHVSRLVAQRRPGVLVASGSVPPGFRAAGYADLVAAGRRHGCPVLVDASREALLGCLPAQPDVVKPNRDELREATGVDNPVEGARVLQDEGARDVLVSLGAEGMVLVRPSGEVLRAALGSDLRGNPTGAGDAAVAAVAAGLAAGRGWEDILGDAVAWSAAAVLQPVAGVVDADDVARLARDVTVWRD
jgi:1-phosphofructokinase family hexose kinase